jgi:hypothetical protein
MVDFVDQGFFKDNSVITLINDLNQEAVPQQITYDEIKDKVKQETTSPQVFCCRLHYNSFHREWNRGKINLLINKNCRINQTRNQSRVLLFPSHHIE